MIFVIKHHCLWGRSEVVIIYPDVNISILHIYIHICIYVRMYICMYAYIYISILFTVFKIQTLPTIMGTFYRRRAGANVFFFSSKWGWCHSCRSNIIRILWYTAMNVGSLLCWAILLHNKGYKSAGESNMLMQMYRDPLAFWIAAS